jgi:hypothetical protein
MDKTQSRYDFQAPAFSKNIVEELLWNKDLKTFFPLHNVLSVLVLVT